MSDKKMQNELDKETIELIKKLYSYYRVEENRDDVVRHGEYYAHPMSHQGLTMDIAETLLQQQNIMDSMETRHDLVKGYDELFSGTYEQMKQDNPEWEEFGYWKEYDIPGCVEEPDAPLVHVVVRHLKEEYKKGPYPVLFMIPGGGLLSSDAMGFCSAPMSKYLGCQIVSVHFRGTAVAQYPAAINDLHAVYQWMADNAAEMGFDMDRVVFYGTSSGGHLAAALPFRLKRYNWCGAPMPRGVVVDDGFFDDRETTRSMRMFGRTWCGFNNRAANMLYMGKNFSSGFIGPEAYANHATVNECKGLPPYLIYAGQDCPGCDPGIEFMMKLNEAGVFCSFYMCGGTTHARPSYGDGSQDNPFMNMNVPKEYMPRTGSDAVAQIENFLVQGAKDFFENDMRRL